MIQIESSESYVVLSEELIEGFDGSVIPDPAVLRTTELCRVVNEEPAKTPFFGEVIDSIELEFLSDGTRVLVPTVYQHLGRFYTFSGRKLIADGGDEKIFENIDFEKEFIFSI